MCVNKHVSKNVHKEVKNTKDIAFLYFIKLPKCVVVSQLSAILIVKLKYIIFKEFQSFNVSAKIHFTLFKIINIYYNKNWA
jgi:hypothetical protein